MSEEIKEFRKANKLTQKELGDIIGLGGGRVSQLEIDRKDFTEAQRQILLSTPDKWVLQGRNFNLLEGTFNIQNNGGNPIFLDNNIGSGSSLAIKLAEANKEIEMLKEQLKEAKAIAQKYLGIIESLSSHK